MYVARIKHEDVQYHTYVSVFIKALFKAETGEFLELGGGTGFFKKIKGETFLFSNWHVFTGRDPNSPDKTLPGYQTSPTHIEIFLPLKNEKKRIVPLGPVPLYDKNGEPNWIECDPGFSYVDLAAIKADVPNDIMVSYVDYDRKTVEIFLKPGMDVCIIGFPFGIDGTHPFPIWKKAMVASEPRFTIKGKGISYLDTPGRPGMSGSPVYAFFNGFFIKKKTSGSSDNPLDLLSEIDFGDIDSGSNKMIFIGVYAGTIGDNNLEKMQLGRFIPIDYLEAFGSQPKKGNNPFPPTLY